MSSDMQQPMTRMDKSKGFTLIELMIAMVLVLVLIGGIVQVVVTSQDSYQVVVRQGRMQESARLAMDYIVRDLRSIGYWGCNGQFVAIANTLDSGDEDGFDPNDPLIGYDKDGAGTFPATVSGNDVYGDVLDETDIIEFRILDIDNAFLVTDHKPNAATIFFVEKYTGTFKDEVMTIVDRNCSNVGIFAVSNPPEGGTGTEHSQIVHNEGAGTDNTNCTKDLKGNFTCDNLAAAKNNAYSEGSSVYSVKHRAYAVMPSEDNSTTSLWRINIDDDIDDDKDPNEELVQGIQNIQFRYGLDTDDDGTVDRIASASDIDSTASLEFSQTLTVLVDVQVVSLDGTATDNFSTSVRLRNRGI